jgi:hypothetical protein
MARRNASDFRSASAVAASAAKSKSLVEDAGNKVGREVLRQDAMLDIRVRTTSEAEG